MRQDRQEKERGEKGADGATAGSAPHGSGMEARGVTRPMAEQAAHGEHGEVREQHRSGDDAGMGPMSRHERLQKLSVHHRQTLWIYWSLVAAGFWLVAAPFTLGYGNEALWVEPSGGRGVWLGDRLLVELRASLMIWSDVLSGLLLIVFGWRALRPDRPVSLWICCFVGIWLNLAPIVFWAPTAAAYLNGTIVGALVIALAVLIPGMPNMVAYMRMGGARPGGWSYNPSSWPQRWILIVLAFAGWLVSRHLAAYQLGYIDRVWEPFFGEGSQRVLDSDLSHGWPISDAALGAFAYTLEFLMGWMGSPARWRTMPWMVTFFGILVIPLGLVHIFLVISQPLTVGYWCTLCLLAAALMLPMIPLQVDEVIAMGQHLVRTRRQGESVWRAFWKGGPAEAAEQDDRTPELVELPEQPARVAGASLWGVSFPWTLLLSTALGVWTMFTPAVFGLGGTASDTSHLGGALIVVVSVIAMGEPVRALRYMNAVLGLGLAALLWASEGAASAAALNGILVGILVAALAVPQGSKNEIYGTWDRYVL